MRILLLILFILNLSFSFAQESTSKFKISRKSNNFFDEFSILKSNGDTIKKLDPKKYIVCFTNEFDNFAIFGINGKQGWYAVNKNGEILFEVHNRYFGEISPDYLVENKIRIVKNGKIGFANNKGKIVIKPKFELVTEFHNGNAIIAEKCKKIPWHNEKELSDCQHFSINCLMYGYINEKGEILKIGEYSFEEIKKEINWKSAED